MYKIVYFALYLHPIAILDNEMYVMNRNEQFTVYVVPIYFSKGRNLEQQENVKFAQYRK